METIKLNGLDWYVTKEDDYTQTLLLADVLSKDIVDDIVDDKRYIISDSEVIYSGDAYDNSWRNSYIRKILNNGFKKKYLNGLSLGGEVRLLTKEEVEDMVEYMKKANRDYWTMSPCRFGIDSLGVTAWDVGSTGYLYFNYVTYSYGVRPVITLNKNKKSTDKIIELLEEILDELKEQKKCSKN